MAILQFFQVSNIASLYRSFILQKSKILNQSKLISMLSRGSLRRSTYSVVWERFPHSARSTGRSVFNIIIVTAIGIVLHIIMVFTNNNPAQPLWSLGASTGKNDRSGSKQVFGTLCKSGWAARLTSPSPSSSKWLANILIFCHESTHLDIMIFINLHHETIRHHDNYHIHCSAPLAARLANIPMFWYEFTHLLDERVVAQVGW